MTVHIVLLIYISFLGAFVFIRKPYSKKKNRKFVFWAFLGVFLVQALRGENVGTDTIRYVNAFHYARGGVLYESWEPLARYILRFAAAVTDSQQFYLALYSMLTLIGIGIFIVENTDEEQSAFWSVFLFIVLAQYFSMMNLVRQSLGMAVGCNVYTVLRRGYTRKRLVAAFLVLLLAYSCHRSAALYILILIPFFIRVDKLTILLEIAVGVAVYYAYPYLIGFVLKIFPMYDEYMEGRLVISGVSGIYYLIGAFEFIVMILMLSYLSPLKEENRECYRLLFAVMISFDFILLQRRTMLAIRTGYYFEMYLMLLIPVFIQRWKEAVTRVNVKMALYSLGWVYYLFLMINTSARGCVPYTFYWQ